MQRNIRSLHTAWISRVALPYTWTSYYPKIEPRANPDDFRQPFGPGWALVGEAGYNKDPINAKY